MHRILPVASRERVREILLFTLVGMLNTAIDFAVLNLLIAISGHAAIGNWLFLFNCLSFLAAVMNSYLLNGWLTFRYRGLSNPWKFTQFFGVNLVGMACNSALVWLLSPLLAHTLPPLLAINISKVLATLVSLCWNYLAIRGWIFRRLPVAERLTSPLPAVTPAQTISSPSDMEHSL
ncbi:MAG TPA: GtrA family protein [Ktedonobacteraceae bacterium]|nr:GtrA family protein [Ktedonobacteraceae bacterium]